MGIQLGPKEIACLITIATRTRDKYLVKNKYTFIEDDIDMINENVLVSDENIEEVVFRIPIVERLVTIDSKNKNVGVTFDNIIFEHTSYSVPLEGSNYAQSASGMSAAIEADNISNLIIKNCEVRNIANYGIWLRKHCTNSTIKETFFHDLGAGAVKIGTLRYEQKDSDDLTHHIVVDNNMIYRYGELMENAVGIILFNASDCVITHNDLHYGNYTGISLGWVWGYGYSPSKNNEVAYNRITNIGKGLLNDLGAIYTLGESEGTHIHHNVISDVKAKSNEGWGIYADEGTTGVLIENNLVYRTTSGGFHQHYGSNNIVTNNIFAWGENSQVQLSKVKEEHPLRFCRNIILMDSGTLMTGDAITNDNISWGNNCYWKIGDGLPMVANLDAIKWIQLRDSTSVYMDPAFSDPQQGDFHINSKEVCKSIGFKKFEYSHAGIYGYNWKKILKKSNNVEDANFIKHE